jgi:hypothetical protein
MDLDRSFQQLLSPDASARIDTARLTAKQKFSTRMAVYALGVLKQIAAARQIPLDEVSQTMVIDWLTDHPIVNDTLSQNELGMDESFKAFWGKIILSAFRPLNEAAELANLPVEELSLECIITYFEQVTTQELGLS